MRIHPVVHLLALLATLAACSHAASPPVPPPVSAAGTLVLDTVRSPALRGNLLGDSPAREVRVYLPRGYAASPGRRYPVVYLLHGFDGDPTQWTERMAVPRAMDSLTASGALREMIVVMPDAKNAYGGSFYANSPAAGRWEDFVARDLVRHVDARYRTLPRAESRGIAGWSMGGYGALHLAARHPEVFGAVYALSPCCLGGELLGDLPAAGWERALAVRHPGEVAAADFGTKFRLGLAALLTPDPAKPPLYVDLPYAAGPAGPVPAEPAHSRWRAASAAGLAESHREGLLRLRGIAFDAGSSDAFTHIPATTRALSAALTRAGVPHRFEEYAGTHGSRVAERVRTHVLPFFSGLLAGTTP